MSIKCAFFSVFQKLVVFCCAIFFGFANAFSANLPSGYTELEYIQSDGNSWIETNVNATNNSSAEIKFVLLNKEGFPAVFGARESKTSRAFNVWGALGSGTSMGINIGNLGAVGLEISPQIGTEYTLSMSATNLTINGVSKSISNVSSFTTPGGVWVFNTYGADASGSGTGNRVFVGRIYYVKMYNNGVLVLNLVPVKRISGNTTTIGMYDTVNNRFYQNAGTGEFTAGRAVCSNGELAQIYTSATGTVTQSGTPTPTNPIEPVFYQQGNMVLRKINDNYADSYDATTGKITRRVGVKVFDGTEDWFMSGDNYLVSMYNILINDMYAEASSVSSNRASPYSTHFGRSTSWLGYSDNSRLNKVQAYSSTANPKHILGLGYPGADQSNISAFKQWLAQQYAAGTPVTVYYPLATPVEENWAPEQCLNGIKIATTAYNTARFSPVVNDLNSTIATIRSVVTNTINQTKAIADLQAKKQTRPDEQCPAGKKCLLVEDNNGIPHWYEIIENIYGLPAGYTPLEYIEATGTQYIDTGIVPTLTSGAQIRVKFLSLKSSDNVIFGATDATAYAGGSPFSIDVFPRQVLMPFGGGANNSVNYSPTISKTMETNVLYDFKLNYLNDKKASVNDTQVTYSNPVTMTSRSLLLFNLNSSAGGVSQYAATRSRMYSAVITNGSNIVFNGVPAKRNSDGAIGMYDLANPNPATAFYTNKGTGTFTAGPTM
jgi:hypothetical protein